MPAPHDAAPSSSRFSRRPRKATLIALAAALAFIGVGMRAAFADTVGADIPLLIELIANSVDQLAELRESLTVLRQSADDARKMAGYADDARQTFEAFANASPEDIVNGSDRSLSALLPELNELRGAASGSPEWAQGSGELQAKLSFCLSEVLKAGGDPSSCTDIRRALTLEESRSALSATFGESRGKAPPDVKAVDHEAAVALSATSALESRAALQRLKADALLRRCHGDGPAKPSAEACAAAAHEADVLALDALSHVSDGVSQTARLSALQLAQQNAERKRELKGKAERDAAVMAGFNRLLPPAPALKVDAPSVLGRDGQGAASNSASVMSENGALR